MPELSELCVFVPVDVLGLQECADNGSVVQGELNSGVNPNDPGAQLPRQVVIPVDCVVPDMPVSMDDSGHIHAMNQKYASGTASVATTNGTHSVP